MPAPLQRKASTGRWSHSGLQSQHLFEWLQMLALLSSQKGAQTSGPYLTVPLEKGFLVHQDVPWASRNCPLCFPSLQVRARITDAHHHLCLYTRPENPNSGPHAWEPSPIQLTDIFKRLWCSGKTRKFRDPKFCQQAHLHNVSEHN